EPDKEANKQIEPVKLPEMKGKKTSSIQQQLNNKGLNVSVIGSGNTIEKVSAAEGEELLPGDRIILITDEPEMPDITGWSLRDVMQLSRSEERRVGKGG